MVDESLAWTEISHMRGPFHLSGACKAIVVYGMPDVQAMTSRKHPTYVQMLESSKSGVVETCRHRQLLER